MEFDRCSVGERLFVGFGNPEVLGRDRLGINGSAYVEAPMIIGNPNIWPNIQATCMIGPLTNPESPPPIIPGALAACGAINNSPYSLAVVGDVAVANNIDATINVTAGAVVRAGLLVQSQGDVVAFCGVHRLSVKKDFDIHHPTKDGWRLTHACLEGPEAAVYIRGRLTNSTEINLPSYWKKLVDIQSITVSLTPIGAHQDIIIKRWDDKKIYLQSNGGMPIDCFYHVYGERIDTEKLIPEYEGTIEDYPGDNSQRSIAGYHYDIKE
jgi:hypothetical protein